jgi:hypothetical protein
MMCAQGLVDDAAFARYKEFGDWIRACYGPANVLAEAFNGTDTLSVTLGQPGGGGVSVDRVVIQEDQSKGEFIAAYTVQVRCSSLRPCCTS